MNSSPTALFDSYEQDFQQFIGTIQQKLEAEGSDDRGGKKVHSSLSTVLRNDLASLEQRKAVLRRVEMELDEADEMVHPALPC